MGALHSWLDRGLRRGDAGRLAAEYPLTMGQGGSRRHRVIYEEGLPVAHSMSHLVRVNANGNALDLGMIGNVYTDPARRGAGLAGLCLEQSVEDLRLSGAALALLWSEPRNLYERAGFHAIGREHIFKLSDQPCASANDAVSVRLPTGADFRQMERLYQAKPIHVERTPGDLAKFAATPGTRIVVAAEGERILAYAATGRGDDLTGVVHEWAGPAASVARCVEHLRLNEAVTSVLTDPLDGEIGEILRVAGAELTLGVFAQGRILDAQKIWRSLGGDDEPARFRQDATGIALCTDRGDWELPPELANELLFGTTEIDLSALPQPAASALQQRLPWPLYVWGFDSI